MNFFNVLFKSHSYYAGIMFIPLTTYYAQNYAGKYK